MFLYIYKGKEVVIPYRELNRINTEDLEIDENGNAIIEVPEGTTRIILQAYEEPPMTDRQFNRIMDELRGLRDFNDEQRTFNDEQRTFNKEISNKVDNLTEIVKKNHPEDFK